MIGGWSLSWLAMAVLVAVGVRAADGRPSLPTRQAPRSDGQTLHVDFEQYVDRAVGLLNAGVRTLGKPFAEKAFNQHKVAVLRDPKVAFAGARCGYASSRKAKQTAEMALQRRFDAPEVRGNEVTELVFSPGIGGAVDLEDFLVWDPRRYQGGGVGIRLSAKGKAADGTYDLDVQGAGRPVRGAVKGLPQGEWVRIIMLRRRRAKKVDLWIIRESGEQKIGSFADRNPGGATGRADLGDTSTRSARGSGYWDDIRVGKPLAKGKPVAPGEPMRNVGLEKPKIPDPIPVGKAPQLFVDDVLIESMKRLKRTLHAAEKHPDNPLASPEKPWESDGKWFLPYSVLRKGPKGPFQAWIGCYRRAKTKLIYTCLLESRDGLQWTRPNVGRFEFGGSRDNNIVWTGRGFKPVYDPRDKNSARRYKGMTRVGGFSPVFSPDGRRWKIARPAFNQGYDATGFYWDPVGRKWIASCKIFWNGKRARGYAESSDYVNWSDTYLMLTVDEKDQPKDQIYSMRIFRYGTVYVGLTKIYHVATDRCELQLAFSRNGKSWTRPDRTDFLANSPRKGDCDYGNIDEAGNPIRVGDRLWFYYSGRSQLHNAPPNDDGRLCLATLRADGFRSVDAAKAEGVLTTKPLVLKGQKLFVNADSRGGRLRVEVIEEDIDYNSVYRDMPHQPIEPYLRDDCTPITGDSVRHTVQWRNAKDLSRLERGQVVRLRFHMRNAKLYSFWTE